MQLNWVPEHSAALREFFAKGMSYLEIAEAINARFDTAYSRSAVLGRAKRLGLGRLDPGPSAAAEAATEGDAVAEQAARTPHRRIVATNAGV